MKEAIYLKRIRDAEQSLGVYRAEFVRTRARLARIYVRIEELDRQLQDGEVETVITDDKGKQLISPAVAELDRLNDQALSYERALGLTADSVRKINENIFAPAEVDPFAATLAALKKRRA